MKRLLPLLLLAAAAGGARAQGPEEAKRLYDAGQYAASAAVYQKLASQEPRSPDLLYDLGNAFFKSGQTGRAIAAYQEAFDLRPRDRDTRENLDFALRQAGEELVPDGAPPIFFQLFHLLSEREAAGFHWIFCWLALILGALGLHRQRWGDALGPWAAFALVLWMAAGGWWLALRGWEPLQRGVIVSPAAEVRSGPGDKFSVNFTAPEGRRVTVLADNGAWLEIGVVKEGARGWIVSSAVERIRD